MILEELAARVEGATEPSADRQAVFEIHCLAHEALTLNRQIINMTLSGIKRRGPRSKGLRAMARDAAKIREICDRIELQAAKAVEIRTALRARASEARSEA